MRARTCTSWAGLPTRAWPATSRPLPTIPTPNPSTPRKVVFSRTLKTADWVNTTIASGDLAEEVDKLRRGGDGYIVVSGGLQLEYRRHR